MYDRLASTAEPQSINMIPLGPRAAAEPESTQSAVPPSTGANAKATPEAFSSKGASTAPPSTFMMSSLQNKNKKKGFKSSPAVIPPKIVFATEEATSGFTTSPAQTSREQSFVHPAVEKDSASAQQTTISETPVNGYRRLVPPSEKQDQGLLPPNIFVTSIDVEEGMHKKKGKKKNQAQDFDDNPYYAYDTSVRIVDPPSLYDDAVIELDYGVSAVDEASKALSSGLDIDDIKAQWDSFPRVTDSSQIARNTFIGWKALAINPRSFTPEMMLHQGRVKICDNQLTVEVIRDVLARAMKLSFGRPIIVDADDLEPVEETFEWTDVLQGDFRIVKGQT